MTNIPHLFIRSDIIFPPDAIEHPRPPNEILVVRKAARNALARLSEWVNLVILFDGSAKRPHLELWAKHNLGIRFAAYEDNYKAIEYVFGVLTNRQEENDYVTYLFDGWDVTSEYLIKEAEFLCP